jgi:hypothetical protein
VRNAAREAIAFLQFLESAEGGRSMRDVGFVACPN